RGTLHRCLFIEGVRRTIVIVVRNIRAASRVGGNTMTDAGMRGLAVTGEGFRVGRVFSQSFSLLVRHFGKFILLGLIAALPLLLFLLLIPRGGEPLQQSFFWQAGGIVILTFLLQVICEAAIIYGAFQAMRGREFSVGDSFGRGLRRFFPMIGTGI